MTPDRFRQLALQTEGVTESSHHGHPDFRCRNKVIASLGRPSVAWAMVKLTPEQQTQFCQAHPGSLQPVDGSYGARGYTNVRLRTAPVSLVKSALALAADNETQRTPQRSTGSSPKRAKRSWQDKLQDNKGHPTVSPVTGKMAKRFGAGLMVIPAPLEVDEVMRSIRKGRLISIAQIQSRLAAKHRADFACPITTGIFAWIAANAANEAACAGKKRITPYWRTLKNGGELNPKYPGGITNIRQRLEAEGHQIVQRRNRFFVANFEEDKR
ncbi:MAG: MmcQ/YjbR family DNA-binding protein [Planctomycetales bacterium]|nr:MmcQ/YjbR family DNA-binding protein [Planctomycetales bacterium]